MIGRAADAYGRAISRLVDLMRRWAVAVALVAVLLTAAAAHYAVSNLGIHTDTTSLLAEDLPFRRQYSAYKAAFPQFGNMLVIVVEGESADLAEDAATALYDALKARRERFESLYYPAADPFFVKNGLLYLDEDELVSLAAELTDAQPLLGGLSEDPSLRGLFGVLGLAFDNAGTGEGAIEGLGSVLERVADVADAQRAGRRLDLSWRELMRGRPATAEERRAIIVAQPRLDFSRLERAKAATDAVRDAARALGLDPAHGVRVRLTGNAAMIDEEFQSISKNAGIASALSLGLVAGLVLMCFGSLRLAAATLATLIVGLILTAAFAAYAIGHLNLMSVAFAVLFIGLGIDFGVHFALRYREEIARDRPHAEALGAAAAATGGSLTLAAVTAAAGFLAFVPTEYVGLSELGVISSCGMLIALVCNFTLLPALISLMPLRRAARGGESPALVRLESIIRRHRRTVLLGALVLAVAGAVVARAAYFDFSPVNLRDPSTESVATFLDLAGKGKAPAYTIQVVTEDLDSAVALGDRLEELDLVDKTVTLANLVPKRQAEKLSVIEDLGLVLTPIIELPADRAAPNEAERRGALDEFLPKLGAFAANHDATAAGASAGRLGQSLARLVAAGEGADGAL
ncbi:MAG: MMPL family transporter, partial [Alphaproteobacteria bacterium]